MSKSSMKKNDQKVKDFDKSYASGSGISWQIFPSWTGRRVDIRLNVDDQKSIILMKKKAKTKVLIKKNDQKFML